MDGVAAVRAALVDDAALVALVPVKNIGAETRPFGTVLDCITLESVSKVDRNISAPGPDRHVRERVTVTVEARSVPIKKAILRAVRHAAADRTDVEVEGISAVTIHTDSAGPDYRMADASIWCGSQDFMVTYLEPR